MVLIQNVWFSKPYISNCLHQFENSRTYLHIHFTLGPKSNQHILFHIWHFFSKKNKIYQKFLLYFFFIKKKKKKTHFQTDQLTKLEIQNTIFFNSFDKYVKIEN